MIKQIRKRDDSVADFDLSKIESAIRNAMIAAEFEQQEYAEKLSRQVLERLHKKFHSRTIPAVEEIQDLVEEVLIEAKFIKVAKRYIIYRDQRANMRKIEEMIDSGEIMEKYLQQNDWRVKENSNMAYSLQGLNNHIAANISSHYWLHKIYPRNVRNAHIHGDMHIHDLQLLASYCCGWDLQDFLYRGFGGVSGKVESKPPKHFRSALGQVVNFFYTMQGEVAGAQALSNFDTFLSPFIRYDGLSYDEVKQAMQEFIFNMNIPTRVGFQTPFTNITLDIIPSKMLSTQNVIIGGNLMKETYGEFQKEMDMFNRAFAEVMMEGDAKGRVFTFPIPTYNITRTTDWDNPVLTPIFEMTAKYGVPYFSNFVNSDMDPDDARSMCCRLRLDNRELRNRGGGLFGANPLTGSIGVVTLNMARIGYLSKNRDEFFSRLASLMDIAKESLLIKRSIIEKFTDQGLFPYCRHYLSGIYEKFGEYWKNHFSTIGLNGMNEAAENFLKANITTQAGRTFALEVLRFMRERIMDYQNETNILFNLEATPAEGTAYRFAKMDKEMYPDILVGNEAHVREKNSAPYYTNSTHIPVGYTDDIFEALDLQDELQTQYTGGTVLHGFLGEKMPSAEAAKKLVRVIAEKYKLPYYTLTPTFSICPQHGYLSGEHFYCPKCDEERGFSAQTNISAFSTPLAVSAS
ncbi:MAG: ribonucleoside triphosphate reductase [Parcubacteria group bacterium]|nr:ribonucleoside triphosphate reductase [Parcubacteria group bacterium]